MSTNIRLTIAGRNLLQRSKQQQRDARATHLTTTTLTDDAARNRESILRETPTATVLTPSRVIDTETPPYIRVNRPTASRGVDDAFLVVTNLNYIFADPYNTHVVRITDPSGSTYTLTGVLNSSMVDFKNRTYLFLPRNKTLTDFQNSAPYAYIYETLDTHYKPLPEEFFPTVNFIEPIFRLQPFRPTRSAEYTISLISAVISSTGNFGAVMAGYMKSPTYYIAEWSTGGPTPIVVNNIRWGTTNQDLIDLYPPNYPS